MKNKKLITVLCIFATLFATALMAGCRGRKETVGDMTPTMVPTQTAAPTAELTKIVQPDTPEPTKEPTIEPVATNTPEPTATGTPTPSPVPTNTPTPTPAVAGKMLYRFQMGDNVYYEIYEDGTLYVTGTGATWDFKSWDITYKLEEITGMDTFDVCVLVKKIVIAEGITRIGDNALESHYDVRTVIIPESLTSVGERGFAESGGAHGVPTEWVGLDLSRVDVAKDSFIWCDGIDKVTGSEHLVIIPTPTPTTPPPTPTPVPNPEKPRLCHSFKMGKNVTYEFWDNGYIYVKGSGKGDDQSELFDWEYTMNLNWEFYSSMKYLIVEEGITYLGKHAHTSASEIWLPKSLEVVGFNSMFCDVLHCYKDGKKVKVTSTETNAVDLMFDALSDLKLAEQYKIIIEAE